MKNYLSFGGGVNSVAMMLMLMDEGMDFGPGKDCEAVYVWMPDWPETHEYLMMLEERGYPITVLMTGDLYGYAWKYSMMPRRKPRWCTSKFKVKVMHDYFNKPCFVYIGIDVGESHRAKLKVDSGMEHRFPLIERNINRSGCIEIIKSHDLSIPIKSGCYICPFQRIQQIKDLRRYHPELFCKLVELEKRNNEWRLLNGKEQMYSFKKDIKQIINEPDTYLFDDMAYPPCQCGL